MRTGSRVKVRDTRIIEIAKKNFELAKYLYNRPGTIVGFDDITWYFSVKFDGDTEERLLRRWELEEIEF